jgi:penicillin-binding protein 1A
VSDGVSGDVSGGFGGDVGGTRGGPERGTVGAYRLPGIPDRGPLGRRALLVLWALARIALVVALAVPLAAILLLPVAGGADVAVRAARKAFIGSGRPIEIPTLPQRSTIYAADGSVLGRVYLDYNREQVPFSRVNGVTRKAVLAIEDHAFYEHGAIDFSSIVRALIANLKAGAIVQGGSTITQQLVKNTVTGDAPTLVRKVREAKDAFRLESSYTKREILGAYLNTVLLGHGVYGIGTAARYYFGVSVGHLSLEQSATLAGMIASPTGFDPITRPKASMRRRNHVLARMHQLHWITGKAYRNAKDNPIDLSNRYRREASPSPDSYWTQYVVQQMLSDRRYGATYGQRVRTVYQGGLKIYTSLDPAMQDAAATAIERRMTGSDLPQSALVAIEPSTGAIKTMAIGNWTFNKGYNLATDPGGGRTAGSAFKAFTLVAALEKGIKPSRVYSGTSPRTIRRCAGGEDWRVQNAEPGSGSYSLAQATAHSVNVVFAQVIDQVGPEVVAEVARDMGITSPLTPVCPLTLGTSPVSPLEMTSGYATLANGGVHCRPYAITQVITSADKVMVDQQPKCERVIPSDIAATTTRLLREVIESGTGASAVTLSRPAAGKTGTGQDYVDAWFMGYVPQLAAGVWVGQAKAEIPMRNVPGYGPGFGGVLAAPIWDDYMRAATRGMPVENFPAPAHARSSTP